MSIFGGIADELLNQTAFREICLAAMAKQSKIKIRVKELCKGASQLSGQAGPAGGSKWRETMWQSRQATRGWPDGKKN